MANFTIYENIEFNNIQHNGLFKAQLQTSDVTVLRSPPVSGKVRGCADVTASVRSSTVSAGGRLSM